MTSDINRLGNAIPWEGEPRKLAKDTGKGEKRKEKKHHLGTDALGSTASIRGWKKGNRDS